MKKKWTGILGMLLVLICHEVRSQWSPPTNDILRSPVDYSYRLSGNFCELRETHFHAGLDIKPSHNGSPDRIYSVADGYISRIKVSTGGYGMAIYIDHPSIGLTSVYAHMRKFTDEIATIIRQYQMKEESFEVDYYLQPTEILVKKGATIGIMGNTGHSFGTHLHFELRDTKTEKAVNPMLYGYGVPDNILPTLLSIAIHTLDDDCYKLSETRIPIHTEENEEINIVSPIEISGDKLGLAIQGYDRADASHNKIGLYSLKMFVDDTLTFRYQMDKISFDQSRYITGFYDYQTKKKESKTYTLCYKYPGNDLEILNANLHGIIQMDQSRDKKVRIEAKDFGGNKKTINLILRKSPWINLLSPLINEGNTVLSGAIETLEVHNIKVSFNENTLFRNIRCDIIPSMIQGRETKYSIHHEMEPLKGFLDIAIKPDYFLESKADKAIIIHQSKNGTKSNCGGRWQGDRLAISGRQFGIYYLDYDTIAPTIGVKSFSPRPKKKNPFRFIIRDNYPTKGNDARTLKYKIWIDGIFAICPLNNGTSTVDIPIKHLKSGDHEVNIEAVDHCGNVSYFNSSFIIK
ncbi:MAG: M23 family metallopeptidase [Saprospiraceae bacterium]